MKRLIKPGENLHYEDVGHGQPLVFLHALPLAGSMWRPQIDAFKDDHRIIAPDLRGFGGSDAFMSQPSIGEMADDVASLLDALAVDRPVVMVGLSMGGYVALSFVRSYAARIGALVLSDTRAEPESEEGKPIRDRLIAFARSHSALEVINEMMPRMLSAETHSRRPEVIAEVREIAAAQPPSAIAHAHEAIRDRPDVRPYLSQIKAPSLIIVGSDDILTPPALADSMAAAIPCCRRVTIPAAGHLPNLERPELFNDAINSFLKSLV
jgi:pimeloyl-ACP methyl ester carboxylesterase